MAAATLAAFSVFTLLRYALVSTTLFGGDESDVEIAGCKLPKTAAVRSSGISASRLHFGDDGFTTLRSSWKGWVKNRMVDGECELCECRGGGYLYCYALRCPDEQFIEDNHESVEVDDASDANVESAALTQFLTSIEAESIRAVRVLCAIPIKWPPKAAVKAILDTWGNHCDKIVLTSTESDPARHVYKVEGLVPGKNLWMITLRMWNFVLENFADDFDWFLKTDDDTFVLVENFKLAVRSLDPNESHYIGHTSHHGPSLFNNGAGYALSRGALHTFAPALRTLVVNQTSVSSACTTRAGWDEDSKMGRCMKAIGIKPTPMVDATDRECVLVFSLSDHLKYVKRPDSAGWYFIGQPKSLRHGADCCSPRPVIFHEYKEKYHRESEMYFYYWMYYKFTALP